jgi:hypothetical protein
MLAIGAVIILAANLADPSEPNSLASNEATETATVLEEYMDSELTTEEIVLEVLDDALLIDLESDMQEEFEE